MEFKMYFILVAAIVPMIVGAIYYHPKVLGGIWMKASGMTAEKIKTGNMALIFGLAYVLSVLLAMLLASNVIHQLAANSLIGTMDLTTTEGMAAKEAFDSLMAIVGNNHRSFGHGLIHGIIGAIFLALPITGIIALFERRSFKYVAVHTGYWVLSMGLMGGVIAALV